MLFSNHFSIKRTAKDDWFDPILESDTPLFVDPFAIFKERTDPWKTAYEDLMTYFESCFDLVAKAKGNFKSLAFQKAVALLTITEPRAFCLGYTSEGTRGHGPGRARAIARAMHAAIERGLHDIQHFEQLGILNDGIGPDGISDIVCTVLMEHFVRYTKDVAARHNLPTANWHIPFAHFDASTATFHGINVSLPQNRDFETPVILVPERFLRDLPVLNADDWWRWYEAAQVKLNLNYEVLTNVDKKKIVATARANPALLRAWIRARARGKPDPYDLSKDRNGIWLWDNAIFAYVQQNHVSLPPATSLKSFFNVIDCVIERYKLYIEEEGGWRLLWNDDGTEKDEVAAQLVFRGIAEYDCAANNIVLDPEVNLGRGPVDFKFSHGYARRAHLEVKKLHNGTFWNGLRDQLISYMKSDQCPNGWLLAIKYRDGGVSDKRAQLLPAEVKKTAKAESVRLSYGLVDAVPKVSASKVKTGAKPKK